MSEEPSQKQDVSASEFITRSCPCCGATRAHLVVSAKTSGDQLNFETLKKHWYGFFKEPMFFDYYRCDDCGMLYNQKFFSAEKLSELYSSMPDNTAGQNIANLTKTQQAYFHFLSSLATMKGTYLELGPDIGLLTQAASAGGKFTEFHLCEPNRSVHDRLASTVGNSKYVIHTDLFDLSAIPDNSVDVITAVHVLDHLLDPVVMTRQLHSKLKPGGVMLVVTHDERSLLARFLGRKWPAHCLQHPHLFNVRSTKEFLSRNGFDVEETRKSLNHFTFDYLFTHLMWSLGIGKVTLPRWMAFTLPLRLGNIMTVARKVSVAPTAQRRLDA